MDPITGLLVDKDGQPAPLDVQPKESGSDVVGETPADQQQHPYHHQHQQIEINQSTPIVTEAGEPGTYVS